MPVDNPPVEALPFHQPDPSLPTFEEVCLLNQPTLRFIPSRSRPAFARALSSALRCVIQENSEDAWLKLFMLPKYVLPSHGRRQGRHDTPLPVDALCNMWIDNDLGSLWNLAKGRAISLIHQSTSSIRQRTNNIDMAISLGRSGMFGKACRILQSSGIAPNNENTWQLLKAKHPSCPAPVVPVVQYTETITLQPDFNILSVLQSFPKDTAAGPSGLRVQHLLDVANIPLLTPICSSLRSVINMLAAGRAPRSVSRFLAGGSLIALNKNKEGCAPDIRPIAVGETLRSLVGKCMCALLKVKAADFFQPLQFGVACRAGAEKVTHGLRICIEEHWSDDDFVAFKVDMKNAFNAVSRQAVVEECATALGVLVLWVTSSAMTPSRTN